jgi:hypothetical protein
MIPAIAAGITAGTELVEETAPLIHGILRAVRQAQDQVWDRPKKTKKRGKRRGKPRPGTPRLSPQAQRHAQTVLSSQSTTHVSEAGHTVIGGAFDVDVAPDMDGFEIVVSANPLISPDEKLRTVAMAHAFYSVEQFDIYAYSGTGDDATGFRNIGLLTTGMKSTESSLPSTLMRIGVQDKVSNNMVFQPNLAGIRGRPHSMRGGITLAGSPFTAIGYVQGGTQSVRYRVSYTYHMYGMADPTEPALPTYDSIVTLNLTVSGDTNAQFTTASYASGLGTQFVVLEGATAGFTDGPIYVGDILTVSDIAGASSQLQVLRSGTFNTFSLTGARTLRVAAFPTPAPP